MQTKLRKKQEGVPSEVSKAGLEALSKHPLYGSFETNHQALYWEIKSPEGKTYKFRNLNLWAKRNTALFSIEPEHWNRIRSGFAQIKRSMLGKTKRPVRSYKGWKLIRWRDNND